MVLRDAAGVEVAAGDGAEGTLTVPDVHPWAPGDGYLYELEARLVDADGTLLDSYLQPVGVRTVEIRGTEFLINGEPFHFRGFGKHEDAIIRGKGHDDALMVHDFELMEWIGANSFRTSHYPYAEEVLDYADRHGIVVIDETAAVGMNVRFTLHGSSGHKNTYSPETISEATQRNHLAAIRELVARDRNHPSVVLWCVANEPDASVPEAVGYFEPLFAEVRKLDPSRPVGFVNMMADQPDLDVVTELADIVMINRYYGWYVQTGDLAFAELALEHELRKWAEKHDKPIIMTEVRCRHTLRPARRRRHAVVGGIPERRSSTCTTGCSTASTR
ncbi:glycoside hydrolase family 2 TIM barrel-domain containing protein [Yinghuangia aomiensis]